MYLTKRSYKSNCDEINNLFFQDDIKDVPTHQKKTVELLTSKTGGAYIPPAKLRMMQESITDKSR